MPNNIGKLSMIERTLLARLFNGNKQRIRLQINCGPVIALTISICGENLFLACKIMRSIQFSVKVSGKIYSRTMHVNINTILL